MDEILADYNMLELAGCQNAISDLGVADAPLKFINKNAVSRPCMRTPRQWEAITRLLTSNSLSVTKTG